MHELTVVSGTGTGVGKTWAAARLISGLRSRGLNVAARKPVQSFDPAESPTDADVLALASGEPSSVVCPQHRSYALAMAPPMAADALGLGRLSIAEIVGEIDVPPAADLVVVEGVGGPRSPLAHDGDTVVLTDALDADRVLLVARPGLGTINEVLLSVDAFGDRRVTVFLNRFDPANELHVANREWLSDHRGLDLAVEVEELAARYTTLEVS
jgi:dethiobiotin synthetase